jgi:small-conductance mechanosensitive channel
LSDKLRWPTFWALVAVFVLIICLFAIPAFGELLGGSLLFLTPFALFFLLGIALIIFTVRGGLSGWLKKFFILTGASAAGVLVSVLLHNLVYGLFAHFAGADFWNGGDEFFFFIMAIVVCPLGFLVGVVGTIISGARNRKASP